VVEHAFALGVGDLLQVEDLPAHVRAGAPVVAAAPPSASAVMPPPLLGCEALELDPGWRGQRSAAERQVLSQAIAECGGDKVAAARRLGMPRSTFYRRVRQAGL
jgi:transcriptional regulator of acetoin/glycerol metabolism